MFISYFERYPWEIAAHVRFELLPFTFRINLDPVRPEPRPNSLPIYIQINDFRLQLWHVAINTILRDPLSHLRVCHRRFQLVATQAVLRHGREVRLPLVHIVARRAGHVLRHLVALTLY